MRKFLLVSLATIALLATCLSSAQQPPSAPLATHQLTSNVYWVEGGVSNSGVIVGDKGVIVVDTKMTPQNGKQLLDEVAKITPKPVTTVILTHRDVDHIGGLPSFPKGIEIIAHEITPSKPVPPPSSVSGAPGPGGPRPTVTPTRVVTGNKEALTINGVKIQLLHWAPAHTSGDLIVYLPEQKIAFAGDILALDFDTPLIHADQNGSSAGWIETVKGMLALDADKYVPGHGGIQTKQSIETRLKAAEAERDEIKKLVGQGKSLAEVQATVGDPKPTDLKSGASGVRFPPYSEVVYNEFTKKTQ
jgi:glyoxylase-like metal-dependent hydrolase (beta-lactamase superfamily II)